MGGGVINGEQLRAVIWAIVLGLVFFSVVMGVGMGLVMLNADWSPAVPWFPLPIFAVLAGAILWAQRQWDIGLRRPEGVSTARIYGIGFAITIFGLTVCTLQGAFQGLVRETEVISTEVSPSFAITYAFVMSVVAAILAEATFRGVVQSRMQPALGPWPTIIVIGIVNTAAHRWGPELAHNWLGLFVLMSAWTWLRWLGNSLWPPLILHAISNFLLATVLWFRGPLDHALMGPVAITVIAALSVATLGAAVVLAGGINPNIGGTRPESDRIGYA